MAFKKLKKNSRQPPIKTISKLNLWLKAYLDETNSVTYLNKTASVKAAGYKCNGEPSCNQIGSQNFRKLKEPINVWLDENGLSENALKTKLLSLLDVKEIKFFAHEGIVTDERVVPAIETQRRALDMALKVKGMNAPTLHEHTGKDGKDLFPELSDEELDKRILALTSNV